MKKNFCDTWDNLLGVVVTNAVFMLVASGLFFLVSFISKIFEEPPSVLLFMSVIAGVFLILNILHAVISLAYGEVAVDICNFQAGSIVRFFKEIPGVLVDGILLGLLKTVFYLVSGFCLYYYFSLGTTLGLLGCGFIFWIDVFVILSLQFFVPIRCTMHNNFRKVLRKCFFMFFDNTGFAILVALNTLFLFALSVISFGLIPGLASIIIHQQNNFRIRLYKYDYLEEHPELQSKKERKQIPWEELIYEDRETVGPRTFRSFLFPWKE